MFDLKGIYPALLTPFTDDGKINEKALEDIVKLHLSQGVKGFYVTGSTAECHLLELSERMHIVGAVRELTKGKAIVIAHAGTPGTDLSVKLARHAAQIGVDAISAIPPFFYKYSVDEIMEHYRIITCEAGLPMIVYHYPASSGVSFTAEDILRFKDIPGVVGVKYTSMDLFTLEQMKRACPDYVFFNGHDEIFLAGLAMGVDGAIGSTFNFMYQKAARLKRLFDDHRMEEAFALQREMNCIISVALKAGNLQATKYLMRKYDIDCGSCRQPMRRLSAQDMEQLDQIMPLLD